MFPGQGSQAVGMGCDLAAADPAMKEAYAEASEVLGYDLQDLCCQGPIDRLSRTDFTQPALLAASVGMFRILQRDGLRFDVAIGHSLGEFSALVATGAVSFADALRIVRRRGQEMLRAADANPGGMAAIVGLDDAVVEALCAEQDGVWPANFNCPGQVVISGRKPALEAVAEKARAAGAKRVIALAVSGAFHSPLVQLGPRTTARGVRPHRVAHAGPGLLLGLHGPLRGRRLQRAAAGAARLAGPLLAVREHALCSRL